MMKYKFGDAVIGNNMKYARILILLAIISIISNCIILPEYSPDKASINKLQSEIAVGVTSKEEVISILGEPDVTRDRFILYLAREYEGGWLFAAWRAGARHYGKEFMDLYFVFDNRDVLTKYRPIKYGQPFIEPYACFRSIWCTRETALGLCHSFCNSNYNTCINSDDDEENNLKSACNTGKQVCLKQCEQQFKEKWCQNPDTNEYILCAGQQQ
jgi:hypothetical protein